MTDTTQTYARLADNFAATIAAVDDDKWSSPSPCEDWTARDIVRHVVESHGRFLGFVGRELGPIPSVDEDPGGAFAAARRAVGADLADPDRANAKFEGRMLGEMTFEEGIDRFIVADLIVHRWDLARATGGDEAIDPADLSRVFEGAVGFGDALRSPGAFGPPLEPPPGVDEQSRVLAFLGRKAW